MYNQVIGVYVRPVCALPDGGLMKKEAFKIGFWIKLYQSSLLCLLYLCSNVSARYQVS